MDNSLRVQGTSWACVQHGFDGAGDERSDAVSAFSATKWVALNSLLSLECCR
jgi:hypothetical protein